MDSWYIRLADELRQWEVRNEAMWQALQPSRLLGYQVEMGAESLRAIEHILSIELSAVEEASRLSPLAQEVLSEYEELESSHRRYLEEFRAVAALGLADVLSPLVDAARMSRSIEEAALGVVATLRPDEVAAREWDGAVGELRRRLKGADRAPAPGVPESEEESDLLVSVYFVFIAIITLMGQVDLAARFLSGGKLYLVPPAQTSDSPEPSAREVIEFLESGPVRTVRCHAVVRVGPGTEHAGVHRLNSGDSVRVYVGDTDATWVKALCVETWHSGWVYRRHVTNP